VPFKGYFWYYSIFSCASGLVVSYYEAQIQHFIVKHRAFIIILLMVLWMLVRAATTYSGTFPNPHSKIIHLLFLKPILNDYNVTPFIILLVVYTLGMIRGKVFYFLGQISMEIYLFHGLYTQIAQWIGITNFWVGSLFVGGLAIISAVLLWKIQQWYQSKSLKTE
jgi:hypothetical protein